MTSVLYDVPGPLARRRNGILAVVTIVVVAALIGFIVYRMAVTGQFSASKWYVFSFTNVWAGIAGALLNTVKAFVLAAVLSLVLAFLLAIGRLSDHAWIRVPVTVVIEIFRAIPVLVLMMLLYYGLPSVGVQVSTYWAVVLALMAYNGSVLAEALRAGIESLPRGQSEAGYAIGLRKSGVMALILLPQAVRAMLPVIVAQLVVTLKDTALGFIITYHELLYYAKLLSSQQGRPLLQSAIVIGAIYIAMCLVLAGIAKLLENRMKRSPKVPRDPDPRKHEEATLTQVIGLQAGAGELDSKNGGAGGVAP